MNNSSTYGAGGLLQRREIYEKKTESKAISSGFLERLHIISHEKHRNYDILRGSRKTTILPFTRRDYRFDVEEDLSLENRHPEFFRDAPVLR